MRLAFAVALAALVCAPFTARAAEELVGLGCPRDAAELTGTARTRIVLARAFLDERPEAVQLEEAAIHQLRYLWGHYRNDAAAHAALRVTLSAAPPQITVLKREEVPYGRDLVLDWTRTEERLKVTDAYTVKAIRAGRVARDAPAIAWDVELRFQLLVCGREATPPATMRVPLPRDPWLLYWHVPKARHRPLVYGPSREVTNPCADDDFADLPHPFYYWYDWLPTRHGPDADRRPFDCRQWLKPGTDYDLVDVTLERGPPPRGDLLRLAEALPSNRPLRITVVVGVLDHDAVDLGLSRWRDLLGTFTEPGPRVAQLAAAQAAYRAQPRRERGLGTLLALLDGLGPFIEVLSQDIRVEDEVLAMRIDGRFRASGRAVSLNIVHTMTDLFGPRPPKHWDALRRGLLEDDAVVYWGHSGLGENFRLAQIASHVGLTEAALRERLAKAPVKLVAFLSCYSYMYFGQDLLKLGGDRTFVFTGNGPVKRDRGPLPVLELLDDVAAHRPPRLRIGDDEVWVVKRAK